MAGICDCLDVLGLCSMYNVSTFVPTLVSCVPTFRMCLFSDLQGAIGVFFKNPNVGVFASREGGVHGGQLVLYIT